MVNNIIREATLFAAGAHGASGQKRKYTGDDYIVHPRDVASIVTSAGGSREMIAAAWLHDVVEDTLVTHKQIKTEFGPLVAKYVRYLTDISKPEDGNRAARKKIDREHIAKAPPQVKTIKLADLISNTKSIVAHDPKFAEVYLQEKMLLLGVLTEGNPELYKEAKELALRGLASLVVEDVKTLVKEGMVKFANGASITFGSDAGEPLRGLDVSYQSTID